MENRLLDYTTVTEAPGNRLTRQALAMMYTRYAYAAGFCDDKDVLEVACGAGQGLGYLARKARRVVGGDYTTHLLRMAQEHYRGTIPLVRLDAHALPFPAQSFDVVILYEAIYYLTHPARVVQECHRILRHGGVLLVCTVNKEWSDFNPSPLSRRYFSARELCEMLQQHQFHVELYGAFLAARRHLTDIVIPCIKRAAVTLHLIPRTMKGKEFFKRLFLGKLMTFPAEIEAGIGDYNPPVPLSPMSDNEQYAVLYAVAYVR